MLEHDPKRVAAIHDLSGYGRSSLTMILPVLTAMGVQTCPLPTAVLSSQTTGIDGFTFLDLTNQLNPMLDHWQRLGLRFEAVYSGFLGNPGQAEAVNRCLECLALPKALRLVDPVLGDNGRLDPTQGPAMVEAMRFLTGKASLITPNLTEAAFLLGDAFDPAAPDKKLREQLERLAAMGPGQVVITSAPGSRADLTACLAFDAETGLAWRIENKLVNAYYPGTGDCFASVLCGARLLDFPLPQAVHLAANFVAQAISFSWTKNYPPQGGIALEQVLRILFEPVPAQEIKPF